MSNCACNCCQRPGPPNESYNYVYDDHLVLQRQTIYASSSAAKNESAGELISRVTGMLPAYSGDWVNLNPVSSRYLHVYETINGGEIIDYSVGRSFWRLHHHPTPTCYLKVWFKKIFSPEDQGEPVILSPPPPYEWFGTGNPCFPDPSKYVFDLDNRIFFGGEELSEPTENGSVSIHIFKISFVEGYEPDDDASVDTRLNGFPTV